MLHTALALRLKDIDSTKSVERVALAAVVMAALVAMSPNVADPDLWGHVQYGRDLLANGLPVNTTYSYIAANEPWINHENLMEIVLAVGADWLGPIGLVVAKMLLGLALLSGLAWHARRSGAGVFATSIIVLLTALGLAHYWSLRPQLFSFVAYAGMLALLRNSERLQIADCKLQIGNTGSNAPSSRGARTAFNSLFQFLCVGASASQALWLVPLLMAAWTNAHGGFLAGGAVFVTWLVVQGIEELWYDGAAAIGRVKRYALLILSTGLATFVNPYGYRFHLWLYDDLRVPRTEITEWLAPKLGDPLCLPLWLLLAVFAATLVLSREKFRPTHLVVLAATAWQALEHQRHIPFFALSCGLLLPHHVESVLARFRPRTTSFVIRPSSLARIPSSFVLRHSSFLPLALALPLLAYRLYDRTSDLKVEKAQYPVDALAFMAEHRLGGRVLCTFNWAQYLLAARGNDPDAPVQVHVDGRCRTAYSQRQLDEHFDFLFGPQPASQRYRDPHSPFDPSAALEYGRPNLVLIDRGQPHSVEVMHAHADRWVLLYQDGLAQLWGRRDRYDDAACPAYLSPENRRISDTPPTGHVTWPAYASPRTANQGKSECLPPVAPKRIAAASELCH
jgi:hypothetical protein